MCKSLLFSDVFYAFDPLQRASCVSLIVHVLKAHAWLRRVSACVCSQTILRLCNFSNDCIFKIAQNHDPGNTGSFLTLPLVFCLVAVLRALKQSGPGERGREKEEVNPMKRRVFCLIIMTTVNMAMTYTPFTVSGFVLC